MNRKIFAIVVTYNGMKWYDRCLGSLMQSEIPVHIVVIDNASTDGSAEYIAKSFPEIHLIKSTVNLGFAKANNIGIRYAIDNGADYVFLLNQDAWLTNKQTLKCLLESYYDQTDIGIAAPINVNAQQSAMDWMFASDMPADYISDLYMNVHKKYYSVPFINAASWLICKECILKVGGFDTSMFVHYGEDNNYCQRVLFHNFKIILNTECAICHDREFRKGKESQYRNNSFKQDNLTEKIMWTNILLNINIDGHISQVERSIRKALLKLKFGKVKELRKTLAFYHKVKYSRELNIHGGLNWL